MFGVREKGENGKMNGEYVYLVDQENMHGNLLDAMSNAIENSSIFLMCLTEKYKDSPSCRLGMNINHSNNNTLFI
jgi:hypothetical protein